MGRPTRRADGAADASSSGGHVAAIRAAARSSRELAGNVFVNRAQCARLVRRLDVLADVASVAARSSDGDTALLRALEAARECEITLRQLSGPRWFLRAVRSGCDCATFAHLCSLIVDAAHDLLRDEPMPLELACENDMDAENAADIRSDAAFLRRAASQIVSHVCQQNERNSKGFHTPPIPNFDALLHASYERALIHAVDRSLGVEDDSTGSQDVDIGLWELSFKGEFGRRSNPIGGPSFAAEWSGRHVVVTSAAIDGEARPPSLRRIGQLRGEIAHLASLTHAHLERTLGLCVETASVDESTQRTWIAAVVDMPATGTTLREAIPSLPWHVRWRIAREVASAFDFLHSQAPPVVHGALRAEHVLIDSSGRPVVCGLAASTLVRVLTVRPKEAESDDLLEAYISTRNSWLFDPYIAPEALAGAKLSPPCDSYAFAMLLWEMAHAPRVPWGDELGGSMSMQDARTTVLRGGRPNIATDCPAGIAALMRACWSQYPADRPRFSAVIACMAKGSWERPLSAGAPVQVKPSPPKVPPPQHVPTGRRSATRRTRTPSVPDVSSAAEEARTSPARYFDMIASSPAARETPPRQQAMSGRPTPEGRCALEPLGTADGRRKGEHARRAERHGTGSQSNSPRTMAADDLDPPLPPPGRKTRREPRYRTRSFDSDERKRPTSSLSMRDDDDDASDEERRAAARRSMLEPLDTGARKETAEMSTACAQTSDGEEEIAVNGDSDDDDVIVDGSCAVGSAAASTHGQAAHPADERDEDDAMSEDTVGFAEAANRAADIVGSVVSATVGNVLVNMADEFVAEVSSKRDGFCVDADLLEHYADIVKSDPGTYYKALLDVVLASAHETSAESARAAANALSVLNWADAPLHDISLVGIRAPGANLSAARLDGSDLRRADLRGSHMEDASLVGALLDGCNLEGARVTFRKELCGHTRTVQSVSYSPKGSRLASGSDDHSIKIWDLETGECLKTLAGHDDAVCSVSHSPDGGFIVSGSEDCTARMWNAESGACVRMFKHDGWVLCAAFSPTGESLATGAKDSSLRVWDARTGECEQTVQNGHADAVYTVAYSPDGKHLASGGYDRLVRLWNAKDLAPLRTLKGHAGWVLSVAFSPNSRTLVSGSLDQTLRMWNVKSGQCQETLDGGGGWVLSVAYSPDGKHVAAGSEDKALRVYDTSDHGRVVRTIRGHREAVRSVAFAPDGNSIASGGDDSSVRLWNTSTGECVKAIEGPKKALSRRGSHAKGLAAYRSTGGLAENNAQEKKK